MSPPSVEQESEEHWIQQSGIQVVSVDVHPSIPFKRGCGSFPESSSKGQGAGFGHQSCVLQKLYLGCSWERLDQELILFLRTF
jgi:hypothetical protein